MPSRGGYVLRPCRRHLAVDAALDGLGVTFTLDTRTDLVFSGLEPIKRVARLIEC
jgi:hypothetical protein